MGDNTEVVAVVVWTVTDVVAVMMGDNTEVVAVVVEDVTEFVAVM
jgi:phenylpyruvate tautomerase PptA (4-oxalocrotonate tautomerase family)